MGKNIDRKRGDVELYWWKPYIKTISAKADSIRKKETHPIMYVSDIEHDAIMAAIEDFWSRRNWTPRTVPGIPNTLSWRGCEIRRKSS